ERGEVRALQGGIVEGIEVVDRYHIVAPGDQPLTQVAPDESGSSGYECLHQLSKGLSLGGSRGDATRRRPRTEGHPGGSVPPAQRPAGRQPGVAPPKRLKVSR